MSAIRNFEETENTEKNIVKLQKQIDENTYLGSCLLWVLDDASGNTNAYTAVKEAVAEYAALRAELAAKDVALNRIAKAIRITLDDGSAPDNLADHVELLMLQEYYPMREELDRLRKVGE